MLRMWLLGVLQSHESLHDWRAPLKLDEQLERTIEREVQETVELILLLSSASATSHRWMLSPKATPTHGCKRGARVAGTRVLLISLLQLILVLLVLVLLSLAYFRISLEVAAVPVAVPRGRHVRFSRASTLNHARHVAPGGVIYGRERWRRDLHSDSHYRPFRCLFQLRLRYMIRRKHSGQTSFGSGLRGQLFFGLPHQAG
mmetsp:Transcript_15858/g.28145  ORF Transcript_15858/g.28145 Transcript_15858/m.28145 type:complete len:201 (-) Transcript_15858:723-1325(-)